MKLEIPKKVVDYLQRHSGQRFEAKQIAEWIFENYKDECLAKQAKSKVEWMKTEEGLIGQIAREIGSRRGSIQETNPNIKTTEGRPKKYYFSELTDADEVENVERDANSPVSKTDTSTSKEHDLYPKLSEFLWSEFEVHSKRIDEKRSSNSRGAGGNKWLYPDLVGLEDLSKDWDREIKDCVQQYADKKTKLWSFEVKTLINRSNVREGFFQAVSNSAWANFGYLVARDIEGSDTLKELRMLASLHGIGFIRLNVDDPSESEVMIPAKERGEINWDTANRLAEENKDFMKYIGAILGFHQTGKIHKADWDYKEDEEL